MFKSIEIKFTNPICNCETQNLSWGLHDDNKGRPQLQITCRFCETRIAVPYSKLTAYINLDKKYPKYKCDTCDKLHETGLTHDQAIIKEIVE